jgi:hypothetical protein
MNKFPTAIPFSYMDTYNPLKLFAIIALLLVFISPNMSIAQVRFTDDFEGTLAGWELVGEHAFEIIESGDLKHNHVLVMHAEGIVYALIKDSDQWGPVRIEGDMLFPTKGHSYLGLIYNFTRRNSRADFGEIYLKGNRSYLRVNPWRDGNVSRLLYEEYKTAVKGNDAIVINQWQKFKAEIKGRMCHLYIGDMAVPKLTFGLFENSSGLIGLKPRVTGDPVWVDNIRVTSIQDMSYNGPDLPQISYEPDSLVTKWEVIGPLSKPHEEIEWKSDPAKSKVMTDEQTFTWKQIKVDERGAVVTGQITEYEGDLPVAYFRTIIESDKDKKILLHFSTVDEIAHWVNNRFQGFVYRDGYMSMPNNDWNAWYDFWKNPEHAGRKIPTTLKKGVNQLLIRVRNGQFASGGFFLRIESI